MSSYNSRLSINSASKADFDKLKHEDPDSQKISIISYGALDSEGIEMVDAELSMMTLRKIDYATRISLLVNVMLFLIKISVFVVTNSFAVVAALTDSFCDLVSQTIIFYTQKAVRRPSPSYPAGRTRLEPVGILIMSVLMIILSFSVIFGSAFTLYGLYVVKSGFTVEYSLWSVILLVVTIALKFILWLYCKQFSHSPIAMALAEDHRNDVLSNGTALIAVCIASQYHKEVWVDPVGGLLISLYIIAVWYHIGKEQSNKLIGQIADDENMNKLHLFIRRQLKIEQSDYALHGFHIGRNMLIELRLIYKKCTDYTKLCDLCVGLQQKLEDFVFVERAYVHFDYQKREKPIHKFPMLD